MFAIRMQENGDVVIAGRFDASRVEEAYAILDRVQGNVRVDMKELEYISSAGLGALLKTQKRLGQAGQGLTLANMNKLVRDVFRIARFDLIFRIEDQA